MHLQLSVSTAASHDPNMTCTGWALRGRLFQHLFRLFAEVTAKDYRFCRSPRLTAHCQSRKLSSRPRNMPCISRACRINIYTSKELDVGLLLVDEKAFVVFTGCVWVWAVYVSVSVCLQWREPIQSVHACRSERQIAADMCGVCVRRACLYMTLACSSLDLWCSVFFSGAVRMRL